MIYIDEIFETDNPIGIGIGIGFPSPNPETIIGIGICIGILIVYSFLGPGGKSILSESNLEQDPILEQREENQPIRRVEIRALKRHPSPNAEAGGDQGVSNTVLYEQEDRLSRTIISANVLCAAGMPIRSARFGYPARNRAGLGVQGSNIDPIRVSWVIDNEWVGGVECPALRMPGVIFTDKTGRPIYYSAGKMYIPHP